MIKAKGEEGMNISKNEKNTLSSILNLLLKKSSRSVHPLRRYMGDIEVKRKKDGAI